jgi:V8-like Glu-specific endopeptidase
MKNTVSLLSLILILTACGKSKPSVTVTPESANQSISAVQSKIIGENNLIKVKKDGSNVDSNLRPYLDAFGIISLGEGVCSGTHIGNGYVLTAGHCILPEGQQGTLTNKGCANIKIYWGYRGSPETGSPKPGVSMVSQCTQMIYAERTEKRDFAVLKVDQAPSASIPLAANKASQGTKITIFGYPQGRPLEWSQYCSVKGVEGYNTMFAHLCDTEPGNSGSTILAISSSGAPYAIGIHDAGADNFNVGTYLSEALTTLKTVAKVDLLAATRKLY